MGEAIGTKDITKARKDHICYWCGEQIGKGSPYVRWTWVEGGLAETTKVHPECRDAWHKAADEEGGYYETMPYEHERGTTNAP